jgi:uncharacterized protein YfeS
MDSKKMMINLITKMKYFSMNYKLMKINKWESPVHLNKSNCSLNSSNKVTYRIQECPLKISKQ